MSPCNAILLSGVLCLLLPGSSAEMIVGGWRPANVSSPIIKEMANFCVQQYNLLSNSVYSFRMRSLVDACEQLVAGMNYKLKMVLENTVCKKSEDNGHKNCPVQKGRNLKKEECVFKVYYVQWENSRNLIEKQCVAITH